MPRDGKSGITVDKDTVEVLKQDKPDGVTWDFYLRKLYQSHLELDKELEWVSQ